MVDKFSELKRFIEVLRWESIRENPYGKEIDCDGEKRVEYGYGVKMFIAKVKEIEQTEEEIVEASKTGAKKGEAEKEVVFALIKSIVESEKYASGTILERLQDNTIQKLLKKLFI